MKINKRIILYLDNQLNDEEKRKFEIELSKSIVLSKQLDDYKNAVMKLKVNEEKLNGEDYFNNVIPKFREKLTSGRKRFLLKTSYSLAAVSAMVIVFLFFYPFKSAENNLIDGMISELNESEAAEIFNYLSNDFSSENINQLNSSSDSLFSELIFSEFNTDESVFNKLVSSNDINIDGIYNGLQSDEADIIYNEILRTKFF